MAVVVVPPQFVIEPRSQTVSQGQTVTLDCLADGEPEPEISWRKGRTSLPSPSLSPRFVVLHNNSLRSVRVRSVTDVILCQRRYCYGHFVFPSVRLSVTLIINGYTVRDI